MLRCSGCNLVCLHYLKSLVLFVCRQAQPLVCRARKENKDKAAAHLKAGNKQAAYECYQRAVDISPATANDFAKVCKQDKLELQVSCTSAIGSQSVNFPWFTLGQQQTLCTSHCNHAAHYQCFRNSCYGSLAAQRLILRCVVGVEGCRRGIYCRPI